MDSATITVNIVSGAQIDGNATTGAAIYTSVVPALQVTANVAVGARGSDGVGVPEGGTTGQVLSKASGTDYDTEWTTPSAGPGGGAVSSVNSQTGDVVLDADDISDAATTNKFVTAAEKTKLSNTSGVNTGDQDLSSYATTAALTSGLSGKANTSHTHTASDVTDFTTAVQTAAPAETVTTIGALILGATAKTTPVDADYLPLMDSAASNIMKKLSWANVKATLKTYFDTLYATITHTHAQSDITNLTSDLAGKASTSHTHTASNVTDFNSAALAAAPAETTTTMGSLINGATAKTTPVDADFVGLMDSAASNVLKKLSWANIKATLKTYLDTLYANITHTHAQSDITNLTTDLAAKQPLDADLTTIAGLTATTDNFMVATASAWASRTPAQARTQMGLGSLATASSITASQISDASSAGQAMITAANAAAQTALLSGFVGDSGSGGTKGLVPAPASGDATKYLKGDGTWATPPGGGSGLSDGDYGDITVSGSGTVMNIDAGTIGMTELSSSMVVDSTDTISSNNNDTTVPTSAAVKSYADAADAAWYAAAAHTSSGLNQFASTTSAQLAGVISDETGSGKLVFDTAPTLAKLSLAAGTATAGEAPLKLAAGTLLTTAEAGAIEMDANAFYATTDAGNRGVIPVEHIIRANATRTFTSNTSQQAIFNSPTNGTLTLETGTYLFECLVSMDTMSATSGNGKFSLNSGGTATLGTILYQLYGMDAALDTLTAISGVSETTATQAATNHSTAGTGTVTTFLVKGTFEVTAAGTIIPSYAQTTAAAAVVKIGSYFKCNRIGDTSLVSIGQWS